MPRALPDPPIGTRFTQLVVTGPVIPGNRTTGGRTVPCSCDCGRETIVPVASLYRGNTKRCRWHRQLPVPEVGERFGRLRVVSQDVIRTSQGRAVPCICDCGTAPVVLIKSLRNEGTRSCGCLQPDRAREVQAAVAPGLAEWRREFQRTQLAQSPDRLAWAQSAENRERLLAANTTHDLTHHPYFSNYHAMMGRCYLPKNRGYHNYGGRGIQVCDEWRGHPEVYIAYIEQVLGPRPEGRICSNGRHEYSIDRIDNDGDYEPGNVRWADFAEQSRNRVRRAEVRGEVLVAETVRRIEDQLLTLVQIEQIHHAVLDTPLKSVG